MDDRTVQSDKAYSFKAAAEALTISTKTLSRQIDAGKLRAIAVSERRRAIPGSEIIRILNGVPA